MGGVEEGGGGRVGRVEEGEEMRGKGQGGGGYVPGSRLREGLGFGDKLRVGLTYEDEFPLAERVDASS